MKKLLLLFVIFMASCTHGAKSGKAQLPVFSSDWQGAFKTAHDEGRQMLVMFSTEWCPQCEYIKEKIFTDPDVAVSMKRFFLVGIDGDKSENQPAMDKFKIIGFPTFIILDPDGKEVTRFNDMSSPSEFMAILSEAQGKNPEVIELGKASALEIEGKLSEAARVIKGAIDDLKKSGTSESGRAARMMKELKQSLSEYEELSGAV